MTDKEYFSKYRDCFQTVFSQTDDLVYLKDSEFKYQVITDNLLLKFGIDSSQHIINKTTAELQLPSAMTSFLPKFEKQDLQIQKYCKCGIYLDVFPYPENMNIYVVYKKPIINPVTNNFVGIRGELTPMLFPHIAKLLFKVHGTKGLLLTQKCPKNAFKEYNLTEMQHIVLFLCISNYSYTEISLLVSQFVHEVTPIQVNGYLEELKLIFHVRTKNQLIEKAIGLNFHSYLPLHLFKPSTINVGSEVAFMVDLSTNSSN